ncbi:hypothetical protein K456DRAFT_1920717 [Colletotrichum gloeosporioides 23]|nr:hypothetical protein K456DRAFT_1920717 [Colletotrichum gloeosporioides 23]
MTGLQDEPSHLCSRCSTIPFDAIVNVPTKAVNLELGLFQEIVSKSEHCSFCRLVIQAFHAHLDPHWRPGEHPDQMCYLQVDEQQAGSSSPLIKVYCSITSDSMPKGFFGSYRLLGFIGAPLEDNTSDGVKIVPPATTGELDYGLISSWIEDCQSHHECSVGSDPSPEGATGFWLVDVQDMCLVQRDWDCRYIALSYVWGDLVAFRSQKTNFPSLQFPGSLNGVMGQMPQVIQDAITFTANVKQRYLWVDSLCIVQDDDTFKERYISRMHLIYQSSLATIVATTGKDANKGLPGISYPREAPYTLIKFAWTFQEGIFSGKCIYFTDYQVFWVCSARRASESNTEYYHDGMHLWENSSTSLFSRSSATYQESVYQSLVQGYSNRTLSHHSDSLSAFAGLLTKMGEAFDWKFVSALPEKSFESFLFWMAPYGGVLRPRNNAMQNSDAMVCRSPTWCWTAWDAYVYWDPWRQDKFMGKVVTTKSEVEEYWISETTGWERIGDEGSSDHGGEMFASSLHEKQPCMLDSRHLGSDLPPNTLMFRGNIIDTKAFEIKSPIFDPACSRYFQGHLTGAGWVYDSNGRHCGTLRGINLSKYYDQEKWEFILLSRSDQDEVLQADIDATPSPDLPPEYPSAKEYYEEIFDTTAYKYRRWWALNIMLVERKGLWVERVAVGQIHADAWDSALGQSSPETIFLA